MTFYEFTAPQPGQSYNYPTLGFKAADGAILDGTLSNPAITNPPDGNWAVAGAGPESGITRYGNPTAGTDYSQPQDGTILQWVAASKAYLPRTPAQVVDGLSASLNSAFTEQITDDDRVVVRGRKYGMKYDVLPLAGCTITAGSAALTSTSANFAQTDVGKTIKIDGAGAAGAPLVTIIASRQSATQVTLAAAAATTVTTNRTVTDVAATARSKAITSATANFTSGDIGKTVTLNGAGPGAGNLTCRILSVQSATQATITVAAFAAVTNGSMTISPGRGVYGTDDSAAAQTALNAVATTGGVLKLEHGNTLWASPVTVKGYDLGDDFGARGVDVEGVGMGATRVFTTGAFTALSFGTGTNPMDLNLRWLELFGPGQHVAGSRGTAWLQPAGSYAWQNVYIHDFDTGEEWYDSTLGTQVNVNIRLCNRGLATGWQTDIFNFIGGRIDYNDTGIWFGTETGNGAGGASQENCLNFVGTRISNNNLGYQVNDYGLNGLRFEGCYFEGNAKEAIIGSPNTRDDVIGPSITYAGCHWEQYNVLAVGIDVWNPAIISLVDGCKDNGSTFTTMFKFWTSNGGTALNGVFTVDNCDMHTSITYDGRTYAISRATMTIGRQVVENGVGGFIGSTGAWHQKRMANGTGQVWESWSRINSSTDGIISEMQLRDVGGVLRLEGVTGQAFICVTSLSALPTADANHRGVMALVPGGAGVADTFYGCRKNASDAYEWQALA